MANSARTLTASSMIGRSESLPMTTLTTTPAFLAYPAPFLMFDDLVKVEVLHWGRLRKKDAGKARESRGVRRTLLYAAKTGNAGSRLFTKPSMFEMPIPVKIMAMLCSSAARITSSSLIEPPGSITAVIPARAAMSSPSRKGRIHPIPGRTPRSGGWPSSWRSLPSRHGSSGRPPRRPVDPLSCRRWRSI